jgi:predicted permease
LPGMHPALANVFPLQGDAAVSPMAVEGDQSPMEQRPMANYRYVSPEYFNVLAIPLRRGRVFEGRDRNRTVALLSENAALRLWPGQDPIGKRFRRFDKQIFEVIGVVADVRSIRLQDRPSPIVYVPFWQRLTPYACVMIRGAGAPGNGIAAVRRAISSIDDQVPISRVQTMDELVNGTVAQRRFQLGLVVLFAFSALFLGGIGIYGVVAQTVARRRREIGLRMALGATVWNIRTLTFGWGLRPVAVGIAIGLGASLALGRVLASLLFEVTAANPFVLSAATVVLLVTAAAACYLPVRRAARMQPMEVLRFE